MCAGWDWTKLVPCPSSLCWNRVGGWAQQLEQGWEVECCCSSSVGKVGSSSWSWNYVPELTGPCFQRLNGLGGENLKDYRHVKHRWCRKVRMDAEWVLVGLVTVRALLSELPVKLLLSWRALPKACQWPSSCLRKAECKTGQQ